MGSNSPLCRFTHLGDNAIQGFLSTLLQSLGDTLVALLVGGIFEQPGEEMVQSELTVTVGAVLKNYAGLNKGRHDMNEDDALCWTQ